MKYDEARSGDLDVLPPAGMRGAMAADYAAMRGMIFGDAPSFDEVVAIIENVASTYARIRGADQPGSWRPTRRQWPAVHKCRSDSPNPPRRAAARIPGCSGISGAGL